MEGAQQFLNRYTISLRENRIDDFFDLAETLHKDLHSMNNPMIKNRRYHLQWYKMCFKGNELVSWLLDHQHISTREEGAAVGCSMLMHGIIHHVCDDHNFKDDALFYRFRQDDGTYYTLADASYYRISAMRSVRLHGILCAKYPGVIQNRDYGIVTYQNVAVGSELVDWLVQYGKCNNRHEAVIVCRDMQKYHFLEHATGDHDFQDKNLFYRFYVDQLKCEQGLLDFMALEQGLAYLGHLDQGKVVINLEEVDMFTSTLTTTLSSSSGSGGNPKAQEMKGRSRRRNKYTGPQSEPSIATKIPVHRALLHDLQTLSDVSQISAYHGQVSRTQALAILTGSGQGDGAWLLRDCVRRRGWWVCLSFFSLRAMR